MSLYNVERFIRDHYEELTSEHGIDRNKILYDNEFTLPYRGPLSTTTFSARLSNYCIKYSKDGEKDYYMKDSVPIYFKKLTKDYEEEFKPYNYKPKEKLVNEVTFDDKIIKLSSNSHLEYVDKLPEDAKRIKIYKDNNLDNIFYSPSRNKYYQLPNIKYRVINPDKNCIYCRNNEGKTIRVSIRKLLKDNGL